MKREKLFKVMLSGVLACSLMMTSIVPMTTVVAQETTEDTGSDSAELKKVVYDGTNEDEVRNQTEKICLVVEDGVEEISSDSFWNCENIVEVELPDSIKDIEDESFPDSTSVIWKGKTYGSFTKFIKAFNRFTQNPVTLKKVSGLKVTIDNRMEEASMKWNKVSKATKYEILYATNKDFNKAKKIKTKSNYEYIYGLKKGKIYYFKVRALNDYDSENMEIVYGDYSSIISKKNTIAERDRKVNKMYAKFLNKRKSKLKYFKIEDLDGNGIKELFVGKKANKIDKVYSAVNGGVSTEYNWDSEVGRYCKYCSKIMVDVKKHRIIGYIQNTKKIGIEIGDGFNGGGTDWILPGKHYRVFSYKKNGTVEYKEYNDNNPRIAKLKFKTKKFMIKNNAKNRAKYCK